MAVIFALTAPAAAQTTVPLQRFRAVELRNGGTLTLRHGPTQRVTLLQGSLQDARFVVADDRLVIDHRGGKDSRDCRLEVEIVTPDIAGVHVSNGGIIESRGTFPPQPSLEVRVDQGGVIDIRPIAAASVDAAVNSGGAIFTKPGAVLLASVTDGGNITYWGDPLVQTSIPHTGVVVKGPATDADKPLAELSPALAPLPPLPAIPPLRQ